MKSREEVVESLKEVIKSDLLRPRPKLRDILKRRDVGHQPGGGVPEVADSSSRSRPILVDGENCVQHVHEREQ